MATTSYDNFFSYVQPYVPECPEFVIEAHVAEAAARFCRESYIWRVDIEEDTTTSGESNYDIDIPNGTVLEDILSFEVDGSAIPRVSDRQVLPSKNTPAGVPEWYSIYHDTQIRVYPTPDDTYTFQGVAVVTPALTAIGIERFIFEAHGRDIAYGAISLLTAIPNKAWSNPAVSMHYSAEFGRAIVNARIRDFKQVPQRVTPRPFT